MNESYTFNNLQSLSDFLVKIKQKEIIYPERAGKIRLQLNEEKLTDGSTVTNCTIYA